MAKQTWFISHPSGGMKHTPTFFSAINSFAEQNEDIAVHFPHEKEEEVHLTRDDIAKADLVLVEVSIPSTGSGIELGWANASGVPVVAFHQGGSEPSPAVKFATRDIHVYITEDHIVDVLKGLI